MTDQAKQDAKPIGVMERDREWLRDEIAKLFVGEFELALRLAAEQFLPPMPRRFNADERISAILVTNTDAERDELQYACCAYAPRKIGCCDIDYVLWSRPEVEAERAARNKVDKLFKEQDAERKKAVEDKARRRANARRRAWIATAIVAALASLAVISQCEAVVGDRLDWMCSGG